MAITSFSAMGDRRGRFVAVDGDEAWFTHGSCFLPAGPATTRLSFESTPERAVSRAAALAKKHKMCHVPATARTFLAACCTAQ